MPPLGICVPYTGHCAGFDIPKVILLTNKLYYFSHLPLRFPVPVNKAHLNLSGNVRSMTIWVSSYHQASFLNNPSPASTLMVKHGFVTLSLSHAAYPLRRIWPLTLHLANSSPLGPTWMSPSLPVKIIHSFLYASTGFCLYLYYFPTHIVL